jgi:hypothetical protein
MHADNEWDRDSDVTMVLSHLSSAMTGFPSFYGKLLDEYGDELTLQVIFSALSELVKDALAIGEQNNKTLNECLSVLEDLADESKFDLYEEIAYCFFDNLGNEYREIVKNMLLGNNLTAILRNLEQED